MATPCSIGCGFEATGFGTVITSSPIGLPATLLIRADELCIGQHMPFHRLLDLGFGRPFEIERDIQRIKLVEVAVLTDRRTRAAILRLFEIIQPNNSALRQPCLACVLRQALNVGWYVV